MHALVNLGKLNHLLLQKSTSESTRPSVLKDLGTHVMRDFFQKVSEKKIKFEDVDKRFLRQYTGQPIQL